jgi:hypothetical protein
MPQPPAGKIQVALQANKSDQDTNLAWIDGVTIPSGGADVDLGTYAPFGRTIKFTATATLAQSPANDGVATVTVKKVANRPNLIRVECWKATTNGTVVAWANTVAGVVNIIAIIGSSVGL